MSWIEHSITKGTVKPPAGCTGEWIHYEVYIPSREQAWLKGDSPLSGKKLDDHIKELIAKRIKSANVADIQNIKKSRVDIIISEKKTEPWRGEWTNANKRRFS